ncbi:MAG: nucleotide exchange factor GrpE [Bacteroidales bacterium]|jgi:molecular chaperone GrpE|nr:nucleotide exchange factor GrpE [Bacteroidales bacterium]MDD4086451.1 nucleotide exchange factor GrpE [Bacteroidales bacterium]MDY0084855.1 nucleotide exchange factor GrpE [Bacteroidales bacterium]
MEENKTNSREMEGFEDVRIDENDNQKQENSHKQDDQNDQTKKRSRMRKDRKKKQEDTVTKAQYDELNDKFLRLFSEFDNYRKRTLKEKIEFSKTASEEVITAMLPVVDDFERAMQAMESQQAPEATAEGIRLIYNKLIKTLQQKGLSEIEALHKTFDTDFHEALTNIPAPEPSLKGKVVDVIQKGYLLNGKVIRFARVVVGN